MNVINLTDEQNISIRIKQEVIREDGKKILLFKFDNLEIEVALSRAQREALGKILLEDSDILLICAPLKSILK